MLKVLYVAPDYPNENKNAAQVRANQLLPRLARVVDLHVFAYSTTFAQSKVDKFSYPVRVMNSRSPGVASIFSPNPRAFSRYAHPKAVDAFVELLNSVKPDVVHFDSIGTFGLFKPLRNLGLKCCPMVVFHPHDAVSRLYASQVGFGKNSLHRLYPT